MSRPADIKKMSDNEYSAYMRARRNRFWNAGHEFKATEGCNVCEKGGEGEHDYLCIACELHQLEEEGF